VEIEKAEIEKVEYVMADRRPRCAEVSVRRGEPVHATASRVQRWLVVEQPGPWGRDALLESRMDHVVSRALHAQGRRHGVRILLSRRPGWREPGTARRVHLARTTPAGGWIEHLDLDEEALCRLDLAALREDAPPGLGAAGPEPLFLVCTNGRHDPCCADFGRPVVRALAAAGVADVWECSHVGGDRFAANVVALPAGVYLGRVPAHRAASMLHDLARGIVDLEHYRGRSCFPPLVQAAEVAARRELGEPHLDALVLRVADPIGDDELQAGFAHRTGEVQVRVRRRRGPRERLTCEEGTGRPWLYDVVELRRS
jgi:hypothetical protein